MGVGGRILKDGQLLSIEGKEGRWDSFSVVAYFIKEQEGDLIFQKLDGSKFVISPDDERTIMRIERANSHSSWNNNVHGISRMRFFCKSSFFRHRWHRWHRYFLKLIIDKYGFTVFAKVVF